MFTPDGKKILYQSYADHYSFGQINIMNANGCDQKPLTHGNAAGYNAVVSPNGSKIAFLSVRDGKPEIYTMNLDATDQRRLTDNMDGEHFLVFSQDGRKIAFTSQHESDTEIYTINVVGTDKTQLTYNSIREYSPAWGVRVEVVADPVAFTPSTA
jgi:TolB protein